MSGRVNPALRPRHGLGKLGRRGKAIIGFGCPGGLTHSEIVSKESADCRTYQEAQDKVAVLHVILWNLIEGDGEEVPERSPGYSCCVDHHEN